MKEKIKRLTALVLALSMCLSLLSTGAWAAEVTEETEDETVTAVEITEDGQVVTIDEDLEETSEEEETSEDSSDSEEETEEETSEEEEEADSSEEAEIVEDGEEAVSSEERDASEETSKEEDTSEGQQEITGFADFSISKHSLYYSAEAKPSLEELLADMPETLEVYLDGSSETTTIQVSWYCVDGDYETSDDYYFQFSPEWDEEAYILSDTIDLLTEAPYVAVFLVSGSGTSLLSSSTTVSGNSNETIVFQYLTETMGLNTAAACGIMANIQKESSFNPTALGDSGTSYGLCQWHNTRYTRLITYCNNNGYDYTTVIGQMHYLEYELTNYYSSVLSYMKSVENSAEGAYDAGYYWCYYFEIPANRAETSVTRGNLARDSYWPVYGSTIISNCTITLSSTSYTYTGSAITPTVTVKSGSKTLTKGTDYTVTYSNNTNAGTATVTITGKGDYSGTVTKTFTISARAISQCTVTTPSSRYVYTGKERNPGVSVKYGSLALTSGTDYTVTYSNNIEIGTGTITITGKGNFTGTTTKTYEIVPAAPVISSAENTSLGIKLTWSSVSGAESYGVFRRVSGETTWTKLKTTTALTYKDTTAEAGVTYEYCLKAYSGDSYSDQSDAATIVRLAQPSLSSVSSAAENTLTVKWTAVSGVGGYQIDYSTSSSFSTYTRVKIADSTKTSTTISSLTVGGTYYVRLRTYKTVDGVASYSDWSSTKSVKVEASTMLPDAPVIASAENTSLGIKLTWSAVDDAESYGVFRRVSGESSWTKLATTTALTYKDTTAKASVTYEYCLKAYSGSVYSDRSEAVTIVRLTQPTISSVGNSSSGALTVKWTAISGVGGYQIDYSTSSSFSSYTRVKITSSSTTSTTISGLTAGETYYVRLRTYKTVDGGASYSYWSSVKQSEDIPDAPVISSAENTSLGVKLTWSAVKNAESYGVFRKAEGESSWTKLTTTTALTYKDTTAEASVTYEYCLKAYNGSVYSDRSEAVTIVRLTQPTISSVGNSSSGALTVKWTAISGVGGYQVDYSTSSSFSSYTRVKITSSSTTSTTINGLTAGETYYVRLRTYKTVDGVASYSYWSSVKQSEDIPDAPVIFSAENTSLGVKLTWSAVKNAESYGVFRKAEGESSWTKLTTTTALTYKDTTAEAGVTYEYCLKAYNGSVYSDKSEAVKIVRLAQLSISSVTSSLSGKITVRWSAVSGVGGYQIDYSTSSSFSSYTRLKIADSTTTSTTISDLTTGETYYVRLRTYKTVDGVASYSYWSSVKSVQVSDDVVVDSGTCGDNLTWELTDGGTLIISGTGRMSSWSSSSSVPWYDERETITGVVIEDGVTSIGNYAFASCSNLATITIPDNLTSIGSYAFYNCSSLTSIMIPDGVTSIESYAFAYCSSLTTITISDSVTSIRSYAFYHCSSLSSITIPDSVTSIGSYAFYFCSSLSSIMIPASVEIFGSQVFYACSSLTEINVDEGNSCYSSLDGVLYNKDQTALIQYPCKKSDTSFTIPNSVTSIRNYAFAYCSSLSSITIPSSVTSIGNYAFDSCSSLTSIALSDSVTSIGNYAFRNCSSLSSITLPDSVTNIGNYAFYSCSSLSSITLSDSVTSIGSYAFAYCSNLSSITLPDGVTSIGNYAFYRCSSLSSITLPDSVTSIGSYTFYYCSNLSSITLPDGVTSIGNYAFSNCSSLTDVYYIGSEEAWSEIEIGSGNTNLTNATIHYDTIEWGTPLDFSISSPSGGTLTAQWSAVLGAGGYQIDYSTSSSFSSYTRVKIASSTTTSTTITGLTEGETYYVRLRAYKTVNGVASYSDWSSVESVEVAETIIVDSGTCGDNLSWELTDDGTLTISGTGEMTSWSGSSSVPWYDERATITEVVIEDGVTSIGNYAFYYCSSLTSITISDSVTSVGTYAFYRCSSLSSITLPDSVTSIGNYAFYYCSSLTSITLPDGVTSIGNYAFYYCSSLTSITLPDGVTSIGTCAFYRCNSLTSITLPDSVTSIGSNAFSYCSGLSSITIPDSVTSIGNYAFYYCSSLTSITLPDSVTSIGTGVFYYCKNLTSITIPASVTSIGRQAFYACSSLTSIAIPASVTSIGRQAFYSCSSLTEITVDEGNMYYSSLYGVLYNKDQTELIQYPAKKSGTSFTIPNSVISIGDYAFMNGTGLTSITIPASVTSIGSYAFMSCTGLTSITLPDSVTSIGTGAFHSCSSLTSIAIPDSVTSIKSYTFYNCSSLTSITIPDSVTTIGSSAFSYCSSLTDVYYGGSEEAWSEIEIGSSNTYLTNATIHYNSVG